MSACAHASNSRGSALVGSKLRTKRSAVAVASHPSLASVRPQISFMRSNVRTFAVQTEPSAQSVLSPLATNEEEDLGGEDRVYKSLGEAERNDGAYFALYTGLVSGGVIGAFNFYPIARDLISNSFGVTSANGDGGYLPAFLSLVSILYGLFASNTFLFCYERQTNILQELYSETYALEMILLKTFNMTPCSKGLRVSIADSVRRYIREEMYEPEEMESPYVCEGAYMAILDPILEAVEQGADVTEIVHECDKLAKAQSRRSSVAAGILPLMHWVFIHGLEFVFIAAFVIFDVAVSEGSVEHQLGFSSLIGMLMLSSIVLHDMAYTSNGLYSFRGPLDERLNYVQRMLWWLDTKPGDFVPARIRTLHRLEHLAAAGSGGAKSGRGGLSGSDDEAASSGNAIGIQHGKVRRHKK